MTETTYRSHRADSTCVTAPKVVLVGPPGAGKSTIGRRLAHALNVALVDTDELIEKRYDQPCGEVFASLGEDDFRVVEAEVVAEALNTGGVLSLGGGAVVTPSTRNLLHHHTVVWVDVSAGEGFRRTSGSNSRPVLHSKDPLGRYTEILSSREDYYRDVADYRVRTDNKSPQSIVADILNFLETL